MTNKHDSARERNSKDANPTQKDAAQRRGDSSYYDVRTALRRRVCEGLPPEMQYTAAVLFEYLNQDLWKAAGAMAAWPTSRALAHNCRTKSKSAADRALAEIVKRDLACELPVPRSALPGERDDGRGRPRNVLIFKFPPAEYFDTAEAANNAANLSRSRWDKIQANLSRPDGTKKDDVLARLASYFVPFGDMFCPTKSGRNPYTTRNRESNLETNLEVTLDIERKEDAAASAAARGDSSGARNGPGTKPNGYGHERESGRASADEKLSAESEDGKIAGKPPLRAARGAGSTRSIERMEAELRELNLKKEKERRARNMAFLRQNPEAAARLGFDGDEGDVA